VKHHYLRPPTRKALLNSSADRPSWPAAIALDSRFSARRYPGQLLRARLLRRCSEVAFLVLALATVSIGGSGASPLAISPDGSPSLTGTIDGSVQDGPGSVAIDSAADVNGAPQADSTDLAHPVPDASPSMALDSGALPGSCGLKDHVCCSSDAGTGSCAGGLACSADKVCRPCGDPGQLCCPEVQPKRGRAMPFLCHDLRDVLRGCRAHLCLVRDGWWPVLCWEGLHGARDRLPGNATHGLHLPEVRRDGRALLLRPHHLPHAVRGRPQVQFHRSRGRVRPLRAARLGDHRSDTYRRSEP
jgi:hypothetical protein